MKKIAAISFMFLISSCSIFGGKAAEEPEFSVLLNDGQFEVREYAPYVIAQTSAQGNYDDSTSKGFRKLFKYITGENEGSAEITMTAPVIQERKEIEMTAPVLQEQDGNGWKMAFVLPEEYTIENAPKPTDSEIVLKQIEKKKVAVAKFSGSLNEENINEATNNLQQWLDENNYNAIGNYKSAGYNPPWTIPYFNRNEILVDVE